MVRPEGSFDFKENTKNPTPSHRLRGWYKGIFRRAKWLQDQWNVSVEVTFLFCICCTYHHPAQRIPPEMWSSLYKEAKYLMTVCFFAFGKIAIDILGACGVRKEMYTHVERQQSIDTKMPITLASFRCFEHQSPRPFYRILQSRVFPIHVSFPEYFKMAIVNCKPISPGYAFGRLHIQNKFNKRSIYKFYTNHVELTEMIKRQIQER